MNIKRLFFVLISLIIFTHAEAQQFVQQGPKLLGTNSTSGGWQGFSVAISQYGNTAIVGGRLSGNYKGSAWVYVRIGHSWYQQAQLKPSDMSGNAQFGSAVAISLNGNTAVVGGVGDSNGTGAVWIFNRVGNSWYQEGPKLVGTNNIDAYEGYAVSISGDGNTVMAGGFQDNNSLGAAWIFSRVASAWYQQGGKLVGTDAVGAAQMGVSVALSGDGNTAMLGGWQDSLGTGAVWVFTRVGEAWYQQGSKLVGKNIIGAGGFANVALSYYGNTALIGASRDDGGIGAAYIFTRVGATWSQQGPKLMGADAVGHSRQGQGVGISGDGNTILVGGYYDDNLKGAGWIFNRIGNTWYQMGKKFTGIDTSGYPQIGVSAALSWDGNTAIMGGWMDSSQTGAAWIFVRSNSYQIVKNNYNIDKILIGGQSTLDTIIISPMLKSSLSNRGILSSGTAHNISVTIDTVNFENDADLEFILMHQGFQDTLINFTGANGSNFRNTVLNDTSAENIGNSTAPFSGNFKPYEALSKFNSVDPSGTWVLKVLNKSRGATGTLESWGISFDAVSNPTAVRKEPPAGPAGYRLFQNYPNPFNPSTIISYQLSGSGHLKIVIYNILGDEIRTLVNENKPAGTYSVKFDGANLSSGIYFYRITSGNFSLVKKMILMK